MCCSLARAVSDPMALPSFDSEWKNGERIKRKKTRGQAKLAKLDPLERAAIMECLRELGHQDGTA